MASDDSLVIGQRPEAIFEFEVTVLSVRTSMSNDTRGAADQRVAGANASRRHYLAYSLFNVPVRSDAFALTEVASFRPIRDCFKLSSSVVDLVRHFAAMPPIYMELRKGARSGPSLQRPKMDTTLTSDLDDRIDGAVAVPLRPMCKQLRALLTDMRRGGKAAGTVVQCEAVRNHVLLAPGTSDAVANIEVTMRLRKVGSIPLQPRAAIVPALMAASASSSSAMATASSSPLRQGEGRRGMPSQTAADVQSEVSELLAAERRARAEERRFTAADEAAKSAAQAREDDRAAQIAMHAASKEVLARAGVNAAAAVPADGSRAGVRAVPANIGAEDDPKDGDENESLQTTGVRRYRISVDMCRLRGLQHAAHIVLSYTVPQLGALAPVRTRPPVMASANSTVLLPHGFSLFESERTSGQMLDMLSGDPVVIQLLRSSSIESDRLLGIAVVRLGDALAAPLFFRCPFTARTFKTAKQWRHYERTSLRATASQRQSSSQQRAYSGSGAIQPVQVRVLDAFVPVVTLRSAGSGAGVSGFVADSSGAEKLRSVLGRADLTDPAVQKTVRTVAELQIKVYVEDLGPASGEVHDVLSLGGSSVASHDGWLPASSSGGSAQFGPTHLQQALYSALGQQLQREFQERVRDRELELEEAAHATAARMEKEKMEAITLSREEYARLESELRRALGKIHRRERELADTQAHMRRVEQQRKLETEAVERRLRDEAEHRAAMHKAEIKSLMQRLAERDAQIKVQRDRVADMERDFTAFRKAQRSTPEAVLQATVAELQGANADLKLRVERARSDAVAHAGEKAALKRQLLQVAGELQRARAAKENKALQDLQQLRVRYLANEQRFVLDGDREQLDKIKSDLQRLQTGIHTQKAATPGLSRAKAPPRTELQRLHDERRTLCGTVGYGPNDAVIQKLDEAIARLGGGRVDLSSALS